MIKSIDIEYGVVFGFVSFIITLVIFNQRQLGRKESLFIDRNLPNEKIF